MASARPEAESWLCSSWCSDHGQATLPRQASSVLPCRVQRNGTPTLKRGVPSLGGWEGEPCLPLQRVDGIGTKAPHPPSQPSSLGASGRESEAAAMPPRSRDSAKGLRTPCGSFLQRWLSPTTCLREEEPQMRQVWGGPCGLS